MSPVYSGQFYFLDPATCLHLSGYCGGSLGIVSSIADAVQRTQYEPQCQVLINLLLQQKHYKLFQASTIIDGVDHLPSYFLQFRCSWVGCGRVGFALQAKGFNKLSP